MGWHAGQLRRSNELQYRAEVQRRAMMSRREREEADYVLEVERSQRAGRKAAGEHAMLVGLAGLFVAMLLGSLSGWLFWLGAAAAIWLARLVFKLRMGEVNVELSNMRAPWDRDPT